MGPNRGHLAGIAVLNLLTTLGGRSPFCQATPHPHPHTNTCWILARDPLGGLATSHIVHVLQIVL